MSSGENTKKCKYCQSEINAKATVCPVCKRSLKTDGCLIGCMIPIVLFALLLLLSMCSAIANAQPIDNTYAVIYNVK